MFINFTHTPYNSQNNLNLFSSQAIIINHTHITPWKYNHQTCKQKQIEQQAYNKNGSKEEGGEICSPLPAPHSLSASVETTFAQVVLDESRTPNSYHLQQQQHPKTTITTDRELTITCESRSTSMSLLQQALNTTCFPRSWRSIATSTVSPPWRLSFMIAQRQHPRWNTHPTSLIQHEHRLSHRFPNCCFYIWITTVCVFLLCFF